MISGFFGRMVTAATSGRIWASAGRSGIPHSSWRHATSLGGETSLILYIECKKGNNVYYKGSFKVTFMTEKLSN